MAFVSFGFTGKQKEVIIDLRQMWKTSCSAAASSQRMCGLCESESFVRAADGGE